MQRGYVLCVKQAHVLSRNEIWQIVMDSDSDEEKYYTSEDTQDEEEPRPPLRRSSISQPPSADFSSLCVDRNCFVDYHTKNNLQDIFHPSSMQTVEALTTM